MKPTRAGIIGLWDYTNHTFAFADGRMVLRGANGSGKTKALEVLFPFVLDGRLDPRRLDPFSGDNRTMKQNVLWARDGEAGYGYAWLEFGDGARFVTVGVGLVGRRSQPSPSAWFFVADGRVGDEIVLVEPDGRPRTRVQLRDALGDGVVVDRAREHRARVDAALFGLGVERYEAMLDLVLTLRRPMLAKDLDPALLSDTLARGLRPLDDDLLEQVARSFDDLEAVQRELDRLARADDATQAFLTEYRGYLRTQARARADAAIEAVTARDGADRRLRGAHGALDEARAREALAAVERNAADDAVSRERSRADALRSSAAFRSAGELHHLVELVREMEGALARAATAVTTANQAERSAADELARAEQVAAQAAAEAERCRTRARASATAAGVDWSGDDGEDSDDAGELRARRAAALATRQADIEAVRARLDALVDSERRLELAEAAADRARAAHERAEEALRAAEAAVDAARADLHAGLVAWSATHAAVVGEDDAAGVHAAADMLGAGDGAGLVAAWTALVDPRRRDAVTRRATLDVELARHREQRGALAERREAIAAEADDAPPPLPWRGHDRAQRPGAPLWRLVRFADDVTAPDAAGYEAALEAAGLLDAWVRPDGGVDDVAGDAFLVVGTPAVTEPPAVDSLGSVLVAEAQDDVPAEVVRRLLAAIDLASITRHGHYRLGPLAGRHRVDAPRFIGATARAAHRAARIAALDAEIAALDVQADGVEAQIAALDGWLASVDAATAAIPPVTDLTAALRRGDGAAGEVRATRAHADQAAEAAAQARREQQERRHALQREAAGRSAPPTGEGLRQLQAAVERFGEDARDLVDAVVLVGERAGALGDATRRHAAAASGAADAANDHRDRTRQRDARAVELATLRARLGDEPERVVAELAATESAIAEGELAARRAADEVQDAAAKRGQAEGEVRAAEEAVSATQAQAADALRRLAVLCRPDLAGPLGLPIDGHEVTVDGAAAVEPMAGDALVEVVDRLVIGVSAIDERRKAAQTRVHRSLDELEHALGASYRPSWDVEDDIIVVTIGDDLGARSVAAFAADLGLQRGDQAVLLQQRERALFEDTLLSAVCRQIHDRVQSTRDLVAAMDGEMRARRMSSGQTVGIAWRATDAATPAWRTVHRLLDGDPAHFGPDELETIRRHFAAEIGLARSAEDDVPYRELLARVLDYRAWRRFELSLVRNDGEEVPLTRARHAQLSGGEKAASLHLPLFAAAHAAFAAARPDAPRLLALDEAFAGIDDQGRAELLSLTAVFDLDLFMTGFDLWAVHPAIRAVAHHDLLHLPDERAVSTLLVLWNGRELVEGFDAERELAELDANG